MNPEEAIRAFYGDTSRSRQQTREAQEEIETLLGSLPPEKD